MVGSAVLRLLKKEKYTIINCRRKDLDFLDQSSVDKWFKKNKPDIAVNAAGRVGGILDNLVYQYDYIYSFLKILFQEYFQKFLKRFFYNIILFFS